MTYSAPKARSYGKFIAVDVAVGHEQERQKTVRTGYASNRTQREGQGRRQPSSAICTFRQGRSFQQGSKIVPRQRARRRLLGVRQAAETDRRYRRGRVAQAI